MEVIFPLSALKIIGGLKNDFYKFQLKDMKDKRSLAATRKSDVRGEGLGDIDILLGHKLTKFQKG